MPAHRIYVIGSHELRDGFDYIGENGRRAAKIPTVSCERRTAKFLSGRASFHNIAEFVTARRSKRYDSCNWATNGHTDGFSRERRRPMKRHKDHPVYGVAVPSPKKGWYSRGLVFDRDLTRTIAIKRLEGPTDSPFKSKQQAEEHGLKLCKEWIDKQASQTT